MPITPSGAEANSVQELVEVVERLQKVFKLSHPGEIWYRGQASATWTLVPGLLRPEYGAEQEGAMLEKFRIRARVRDSRCPETDDYVHWFCLMQHYGLPTRFLDWSEAALVAAYFAVSDTTTTGPAAVWAMVPSGLNESQGLAPGFYHLRHPSTQYLLTQVVATGHSEDLTMAIAAPEIDIRMMVQQAVFTVHGSKRPLEEMDLADRFLLKITIPEAAKVPMRNTLAVLGFRRSNLYPDLDNLAGEIADTHRSIAADEG